MPSGPPSLLRLQTEEDSNLNFNNSSEKSMRDDLATSFFFPFGDAEIFRATLRDNGSESEYSRNTRKSAHIERVWSISRLLPDYLISCPARINGVFVT